MKLHTTMGPSSRHVGQAIDWSHLVLGAFDVIGSAQCWMVLVSSGHMWYVDDSPHLAVAVCYSDCEQARLVKTVKVYFTILSGS